MITCYKQCRFIFILGFDCNIPQISYPFIDHIGCIQVVVVSLEDTSICCTLNSNSLIMYHPKNLILLLLLVSFISCSRNGTITNPPPPPPPPPSGVNFQLLTGWWKVAPGNSAAIQTLYFGSDNFHFESYGIMFGNRVGSWSQLPNDSFSLSITGGFSAPEARGFKIVKLTATDLEFLQDAFKGVYQKLDSPMITSKPISSMAGTGVGGFSGDGGVATAAQIYTGPFAIDAAYNIYLSTGYRIRKINAATGIITTLAGTGVKGFTGNGGLAINAQIQAESVAVDANGNIFISDYEHNSIRKINASDGMINMVAGNGSIYQGFSGDGGPAINAQLGSPSSLCFDAAGNLYFFDSFNRRIRKIAAGTGIITTVAGNGSLGTGGDGGPALSAQLFPGVLTVDNAGNIYIADGNTFRMRKITASTGIINTIAGTGSEGYNGEGVASLSAKLNAISALRVDAVGNIYFSEWNNPRIRKIASDGKIYTLAGTGTSSYTGEGPHATAYDISGAGSIYVDAQGNIIFSANNRIRKVIQ